MSKMTNPTGCKKDGRGLRCGPLCIVERRLVDMDGRTRDRIAALAEKIKRADRRIGDISAFGPGVHKGCCAGSGIWIGDAAEIRFMGRTPGKRFDYRLGWLAGLEDVVVIGGSSYRSFEDYQRQIIGAPGLRYLNVDRGDTGPRCATQIRCLRDPTAYRLLISEMTQMENVTIHSHQTTGTIWALAARLNRDTGKPVHVAGPPPLLSRRANDKIWFGSVARRLLGPDAIPAKRTAHSWTSLTRHVAALARKWDRLVVKVPDSAGSEGNFVVHSRDVLSHGLRGLNDRLRNLLSNHGNGPGFPVLVEVWDANVRTSPSVQVWIPLPVHGPPIIEGVFEQVLTGEDAAFAGAVQASLPERFDQSLCHGAMQLSVLFQHLGFFGRCSFDALITGADDHVGKIHWIECNARWGGASIPMSLVNRLTGLGRKPCYTIVQNDQDFFRPTKFADALEEFSDLSYAHDQISGVIFLTPNLMEEGKGAHFLMLADDARSAMKQAQNVLDRLQCRD